MGLGVMQWPLRPAAVKKLQVSITVHGLEGLKVTGGGDGDGVGGGDDLSLIVVVKWRGSRGGLGYRFAMKQSQSRAKLLQSSGAVEWEQSFDNICSFALAKDGVYQPWPVSLVVCKPVQGTLRAKPSVVGTVFVDLAELIGNAIDDGSRSKKLPITCNLAGSEMEALLSVSVTFIELRHMFEGFENVQKFIAPAMTCMGDPMWDSDDERTLMSIRKKRSFRKGRSASSSSSSPKSTSSSGSKKLFTASSPARENAAGRDILAAEDGKMSPGRSEEKSLASCDESVQSYDNPSDVDSVDDSEEDAFVNDENEGMYEKSISYGTLAGANLVAEEVIPFHRDESSTISEVGEGDIMSVHSRAMSAMALPNEASSAAATDEQILSTAAAVAAAAALSSSSASDVESSSSYPSPLSMKGIISWRKRKLNFRSPRSKGEPLLNKAYGEEGGDEIDWDRRQSDGVSTDDRFLLSYHNEGGLSATSSNANEALDFGDELFTVGKWESKDLLSRDGLIKLCANVFFASFDQRSESAAGESACTALVAVIADWLHTHPGLMPSKAEFDMLIRDGSAEWRKLCEVDAYKGRFPDRHFDLETVLEAGVRPLAVVSAKSFVGFFQPEGVDSLGDAFDFLKDAMTFDAIWDEIERFGPAVYIVSWNDHFFVLRIEENSCYIIDTLGERLYEGCNQAYILHFDDTTTLSNVPKSSKAHVAAASEAGASKDKSEKGEKTEKNEKVEKKDKVEKIGKNGKAEKSEKRDRVEKSEKNDKVEKLEKRDRVEKSGEVKADNKPAEAEGISCSGVEAVASKATNGDVATMSINGWKGACRQFVKGFLAAIQLREAELEAKKIASGKSSQQQTQQSIYQKLQIEFHYAKAVEVFPTSKSLGLLP